MALYYHRGWIYCVLCTTLCCGFVWSSEQLKRFPLMDSKNILFFPDLLDEKTFGLHSSVCQSLVARGHNITILGTTSILDNFMTGYHDFDAIFYESLTNSSNFYSDRILLENFTSDSVMSTLTNLGLHWFRYSNRDSYLKECSSMLGDQILIRKLISSNFDKIVCDVTFPCCSIIARYINVSFVNFASKGPLGSRHFRWYYVPNVLSIVPEFMSGFTNRMTLGQRLQNVLLYLHSVVVYDYWMFGAYDNMKSKHGVLPSERTFEIVGKADLLLLNIDFTIEFPRPYMPNVIFVGGILARKPSKLNKGLESFLHTSVDGVIVVSLNSHSIFNPELLHSISMSLATLPQKVLWNENGYLPQTLGGGNMEIFKANELNDVLGQGNVKAFLFNGNIDEAYMAIFHAVPSVAIPTSAEESEIALRLEDKGISISLNLQKLTGTELSTAVNHAVNNNTFRERVLWWSEVHHDFHQIFLPPIDRTVFWIEHVMQFGGGHLRSAAFKLNTVQYFLLDIMSFMLVCVVFLVLVIRMLCLKYCNKKLSTKQQEMKLKQH
ncbi:UDP-glucuronosyltransferase 2B15-like [Anneissia japonica]|uniref:UDP-glucuronosyltransferase 2B15-like n=1 Tax=Anneissia japonica TaxID=1529436 RepID=UPI0014256649|nr:UDP-glucuronosyltransferase 2B15-like [Anneissia japonica]